MASPPLIHVACHGDATDIDSFSGIPWHITDGLRRVGADARGLTLGRPSRLGRVVHAAGSRLRTGGHGGYQYSPGHLDRIWGLVRGQIRDGCVLNLFQLYAPSVVADPGVRRWFYIDATLCQLIEVFGDLPHMAPRARTALLAREREGYAAAQGVIAHSEWAARSVAQDYGIDPARVHVVVAGANLDLDRYAAWRDTATEPAVRSGPLRLVFTGMDAERKGLDRLLAAIALAAADGARLTLDVIGCGPATVAPSLRQLPGLRWHGRVDKRTEPDRFLALVAGAEVGCLLSRRECGGIGQREYAAFGLALVAPDVGGAAEHAGRDRAVLVGPDATAVEIAAILGELATRGALYRRLRAAAWASRDEALQTTTARALLALMTTTS